MPRSTTPFAPRPHPATVKSRTRGKRNAGRPRGAVSEETRARILDAACECFATNGYSRTSNEDIASLAGLTTGALYHYFGSKAELFAAVHRHVHEVLVGVYRQAFAEKATCVEQLCAGLDAALDVTSARPAMTHFAAIASLEIERHPELMAILESDTQEIRGFFRHLFAEAHRRGEIAADVDTESVVNLVQSSLFGLVWLRSQVQRAGEYEAAIRAFQQLLRGVLFVDPARAEQS